jgi:uncharacterized protein (DUF433 family)
MKRKMDYRQRVVLDPHVHFGKPCIAGTRIPVEDVLELIQEGISFKEITEKYYPDLAIEDIKASGVILLRIKPENLGEVHAELKGMLEAHDERELRKFFCTVEPGRHRIRLIQPP